MDNIAMIIISICSEPEMHMLHNAYIYAINNIWKGPALLKVNT